MKFNFSEVDVHMATLGQVVQAMIENLSQIKTAEAELMTEFQGSGATGYEQIMAQLKTDADNYNTTLGNLNAAIKTVAGTQGLVHDGDIANGKMFMAI
jgi:uncharacterized protein YukE